MPCGSDLKKKGQRAQSQNLGFQVASLSTHLALAALLDRIRHIVGGVTASSMEEGMKQFEREGKTT